MEVVRSSYVCQWLMPLWLWLRKNYEASLLSGILQAIARGFLCACAGSVLVGFFRREGVLSRAWPGSILCRFLTGLLSIPTRIFQLLYRSGREIFEASFFARIAFAIVESTPVMVAWVMLAVMVVPYDNWSNGYSFMAFLGLAVFAVFAGMRDWEYRLDLTHMGPWLVAFFGIVLAAWPLSAYSGLSKRFLVFHITCALCVLVVVSTVRRKDQLYRLLGSASLALVVMSVYAVIQRIQGVEVNPAFVDMATNKDMPGRVFAFYENPNAFGEVLVLLLPLAVALMLGSKKWSGRFLGFFGAGLGCVALAMTYSRAGWVGILVAAFLFVCLWKPVLIPVGILLCLAVLPILPDTIFTRLISSFNMHDTTTSSRFPYYQAAGEFLKGHPLTGAGLGTDAVRQAIKDLNLFHGDDKFVHCHNLYLQVWCETGLVGLITFVGGILWTFKKGARSVKNSPMTIKLPVVGSITALIGAMVCGIADYIWNYPRVMLIFWFVCAIALAGAKLATQEEKK